MRAQLSSHMAEALRLPILSPLNTDRPLPPVALDRATCVVGRGGVHLPLPSKQVSRVHALIVNDQDCVYIRDLASRNHTFVNDQPVRETLLDESDVIQIGDFAFKCESGFRKSPAPVVYQADRGILKIDGSADFTISQRTTVIGSREECDLRLTGKGVLPVHAVIFERNARRYIRDLHSEAGTFVNGEKIREEQIKPGDEIAIGGIKLRYVIPEKAAESSSDTISDAEGIAAEGAQGADLVEDESVLPLVELQEPSPPIETTPAKAEATPASEPMLPSEGPIPLADEPSVEPIATSAPSPILDAQEKNPEPALAEDSLIPLTSEAPATPTHSESPAAPSPHVTPTEAVAFSAPAEEVAPLAVGLPPTPPPEPVFEEKPEPLLEDKPAPEPVEKPAPVMEKKLEPELDGKPAPIQQDEESPEPALSPREPKAAPPEPMKVQVSIDINATARAIETGPEEAAAQSAPAPPPVERITELVGDIAGKAQELETAWRDYRDSGPIEETHPGSAQASKDWDTEESASPAAKPKPVPGERDGKE